MKKAMLCVFSLIFILLVSCTAVSFLVESWMTPDVLLTEAKAYTDRETGEYKGGLLPAGALRYGGTGEYVLRVEETEDGWRKGTRVSAVSVTGAEHIEQGGGSVVSPSIREGGSYVLYASKPVADGEAVRVFTGREKRADRLILRVAPWSRDGLDEALGKNGFEKLASGGEPVFVSAQEVTVPFLEDEIRGLLSADGVEVLGAYSLTDLEALADALLPLALAGAVFGAVLLFWGWFCRGVVKGSRARFWTWPCIAAGLAGAWLVLSAVRLPSSLLPERMLTDPAHFSGTLHSCFDALVRLREAGIAASWIEKAELASSVLLWSWAFFLAVFLLSCLLPAVLRRVPRGRHARRG